MLLKYLPLILLFSPQQEKVKEKFKVKKKIGKMSKKKIEKLKQEIKDVLIILDERALHYKIIEDTSSYTINKKYIHMCLLGKECEEISKNKLMYIFNR